MDKSALRATLERQSVILRSIGDAVIATDSGGDVELMNPVAEALTGWKEEDARGRPLAEVFRIVNEETRAELESPVARVLREGVVVRLANHTLLLSRDGREIPITDSGAPIRDESGAITGVVLVFRDQTAEREAQARLLESGEMFRATFEQAAVGMILLSLDGGFLRANRFFMGMTGYSAHELYSMNIMDMIPPEDRAMGMDCMRQLKDGKALTCGTEKRLVRRDGSLIWVEMAASLVEEMEGVPGYFVVSAKDITGRKEAERQLRMLSVAVEQAGESIVVTDRAGNIQYVNKAFERTTGYTRQEAIGQNPRILKSGKHDEGFYRRLWKTISSGRTWQGRFVNRRKDGTLYTEDVVISPVFDESGSIVNYVAGKYDVTEHVKVEAQFQQAQKMESVGRLAGGVAHDFNNMLGVIMGYAELALSRIGQDSPVRGHLEKILSAAERSTGIIQQLLAFAKRQPAAPVVLDINKTAEGMLKMLKRLIGEDIALEWLPGPDLWKVKIDPAQVDQILVNLCVNARDAIADVGKITIETANVHLDEAYCADHPGLVPGDYAMLAVSDTGCGMDKETLEKAFEPFFTTKEVGKGTGLGLATVYGIVKQNSGFINIYSEPGQGTTIKIYLPRVGGEAAEIKEAPKAVPGGRGETVLVVEDEEAILDLAATMLERLGYRVLRARTAEKAIEIAGLHREIRLLLTDVVMPGMNGRDLAGRLSAISPGLKVLYMSGYTANVIAHHGVLDEGVKFLQKPFTLSDIALKVREAIDA
ncbi:MAG: PAS domain S-box protein [Deltaproteobacteria bacterium]